ncbi:filamin-binding LIM protein 1 isoform X2 [Narcine bancroftii]|uniref:filamin-binding LIM protein 1 isoform X2 n=1 Tax=Narcine bancroftii TaxID=1343680 RepID=UPI0038322964
MDLPPVLPQPLQPHQFQSKTSATQAPDPNCRYYRRRMSQIKKVSSVFIQLSTPGTISTPKTHSSLEAARVDDHGHQKLVPSAPKSRSPSNKFENAGVKGVTGIMQSASLSANEDYLPLPPPPPPPAQENTRDAFHPSEMPLPPPPPSLYSCEGILPSLNDFNKTNVQKSYGGAGPKQQDFIPPSDSEKHDIPSVGMKLENSLPQTVNDNLNGLSGSRADTCSFCNQLIPSTIPALEAMNKIFHENCFKCRKCNCRLVGKKYYILDGDPHCDSCYQNTLEKCGKCNKTIMNQIIRAVGKAFHPECFTCIVCHRLIGTERFGVNQANEIHCIEDFQRKYAPQCCACKMPITPENGKEECINIELFGLRFHVNCYRCEKCGILLSPDPTEEGCFPLNKQILCKTCHISLNTSSTT